MKTTTKILIAAIASAGVASAALAQHHSGGKGPRGERMFHQMDTDGDGRVTRADAATFAAARFAQMDADGNGEISRDERRAARQAHQGERIARIDTNGDGVVTQDEMRAIAGERANRRFARIDADGDGTITVAELTDMRSKRGEGRRHHRHGHDDKRGDRAEGARGGPVTQAMAEERTMKRFDRIDADGDGVITLEDIRTKR